MKYVCLVYLEADKLHAIPDEVCLEYGDRLHESGHWVGGAALQPVHTATTLRVRNGQLEVTDGPFAETMEQLAGFYLVETRDLNEAIALASRIPPARTGSIEIRPVRELHVPTAQAGVETAAARSTS